MSVHFWKWISVKTSITLHTTKPRAPLAVLLALMRYSLLPSLYQSWSSPSASPTPVLATVPHATQICVKHTRLSTEAILGYVWKWDGDMWGLGTWGQARRGTWGHQVWDVWDGDAGTSKTGTQGTRDVNDYRKSRRYMRYLFLRENVLQCNIRFHLPKPHWTPYDVYTKRFFIIGVSALTIVIRIRVNFHCRVIFPCACVKFTFANKIEAMYERSRVSESRQFISCLYLIYEIKIYLR